MPLQCNRRLELSLPSVYIYICQDESNLGNQSVEAKETKVLFLVFFRSSTCVRQFAIRTYRQLTLCISCIFLSHFSSPKVASSTFHIGQLLLALDLVLYISTLIFNFRNEKTDNNATWDVIRWRIFGVTFCRIVNSAFNDCYTNLVGPGK